jgi:hypothetical protein
MIANLRPRLEGIQAAAQLAAMLDRISARGKNPIRADAIASLPK